MRVTLIIAIAFAMSFSSLLPGGSGNRLKDKDNTIGECENLGSNSTVTVNWRGAFGAVLSAFESTVLLGAVFNLMAQFSKSTNWNEYADDLQSCVQAMIEEAIIEDNLEQAKNAQITIAEQQGLLLDEKFAIVLEEGPNLTPTSQVIKDIESIIKEIENRMGDIRILFNSASAKHEKFAEFLLDALVAGDTLARFGVIAAYKCGGVPDAMIRELGESYMSALDDNLKYVCDPEYENSMQYILDKSDFGKWGSGSSDLIVDERNSPCECCIGPIIGACVGAYECQVYDRYRAGLEIGSVYDKYGCCGNVGQDETNSCESGADSICEGSGKPDNCKNCRIEGKFKQCGQWFEDTQAYARTTYDDLLRDISDACTLVGNFRGYINTVINMPAPAPGDELCEYFNELKKEK